MGKEILKFVCQYRPVQVLALLPLEELRLCSGWELSALAKYVNFKNVIQDDDITMLHFFCERFVDQRFLAENPDNDYRLCMYNNLMYKESPQYLFDFKEVTALSDRQLHLMINYLYMFAERNANWTREFKQQFYTLIAASSSGFVSRKTIVVQLQKILSSSECKMNLTPFQKSLRLPHLKTLEIHSDSRELIYMFNRFGWISNNVDEAKAIAAGFGLPHNIFWPTSQDYIDFCKLCQNRKFHFFESLVVQRETVSKNACFFCCVKETNAVRIPCGHVIGCFDCEHKSRSETCHVCRQESIVIKLHRAI